VPQPDIGKTNVTWSPTGQAALGVEHHGAVATSSDKQVAIASITKMVTALAVLEKKPLRPSEPGQLFYFTKDDEHIYQEVIAQDGAGLAIQPGQSMTQRQALEAMILPSANNIAMALSRWVFGSEEAYVTYANEMLKRLGFTQTRITGSSGLETDTTSTPAELIKIVELSLQSPVIATIVEQPEVIIPGFTPIKNINHISGVDKSVHAIKVGLNDAAGSCLVFWVDPSVSGGPKTKVYGVVVGQPNFNAVRAYVNDLVEHVIPANFSHIKVAKTGQPISTYTDQAGELITTFAKEDILVPHWQGKPIAVHMSKAKATNLEITTGSHTQTYALSADKQPSFAFMWRLTHPFD
jgi:D-alanyl-D-alanine carboxypeptidase (penicillin-binding protein 5/6)